MSISKQTLDIISKKVGCNFKGKFRTYDTPKAKVSPVEATPISTPTTPIVPEIVVTPPTVEATVIDVVNTPELTSTPIIQSTKLAIDENATAVQLIDNTNQ